RGPFPWDKVAHFILYWGLGWTLGRAIWVSGRRTANAVWGALAFGLVFGALDEWHQGALLTRQTSFADWLADAAGVSFGLAAHLWPRWRRERPRPEARPSAERTEGATPR
ncbi:MAG: VanZ family protein, partial [Gemmatimonadota bacterium]